MPPISVTKPQLRELIVDFYSTHDPERLRLGVDVNGMVDWTLNNGIEQLNNMLSQAYGVGIDLNKKIGNSLDQFKRASTALVDMSQIEAEENKRNEIYVKLYKFYEMHDPSKLSGIEKIVEYAMYQGIDALNRKLYMKYSEDLGNQWKFQNVNPTQSRMLAQSLRQNQLAFSANGAAGGMQNDPGNPRPKPPAPPMQHNGHGFGNGFGQGAMGNNAPTMFEQRPTAPAPAPSPPMAANFGNQQEEEDYGEEGGDDYEEAGDDYQEEYRDSSPPPPNMSFNNNPPNFSRPPAPSVPPAIKAQNPLAKMKQQAEDMGRPFTMTAPPPPEAAAHIDDGEESDEDDFLPPPPPAEDFIDRNTIGDELKRFYGAHDPGKVDFLEAIVEWATRIGRIEFNKKLLQLYGNTLDDPLPSVEDEEKPVLMYAKSVRSGDSDLGSRNTKQTKPKPAPPAAAPNPYGNMQREASVTSGYSESSKYNKPKPPAPAMPAAPQPQFNAMSPKPMAPVAPAMSRQPSFNSQPAKPPKPQAPPPMMSPQPTRPNPPAMTSPPANKPPPPMSPKANKPPAPAAPAPIMSYQQPNTAAPEIVSNVNQVACDNYRLNMTGASFGDCVCGMPRNAHRTTSNNAVRQRVFSDVNDNKNAKVPMPKPAYKEPAKKPAKPAAPAPVAAPVQPTFQQQQAFGGYNQPPPQQQYVGYQQGPPNPYGNNQQQFGGYNQGNYGGYQQSPPNQGGYQQPPPNQGGYQQQAPNFGYQQAPPMQQFGGYNQQGAAAPTFGGFQPGAPTAAANYAAPDPTAGPTLVNSKAGGGQACNNYRLDMTGATFGVCVCGFPRADHRRK